MDKIKIDSITNAITIGDNETPIHRRRNQQLQGKIPNGCQRRLTIKSRKKYRIFHISLVITATKEDIMQKNIQNRNRSHRLHNQFNHKGKLTKENRSYDPPPQTSKQGMTKTQKVFWTKN